MGSYRVFMGFCGVLRGPMGSYRVLMGSHGVLTGSYRVL